MMRRCFLFVLVVYGVVGADEEQVSTKEGEIVKLLAGVKKNKDEEIMWYFNGIRIAMINGGANTTCYYDVKNGIFRHRLEGDFKTGSLTINGIRPEHAGRYEAEYIKRSSNSVPLERTDENTCNNTAVFKLTDRDEIIKIFKVEVTASPSETNKHKGGEKPDSSTTDPDPGLSSGAVIGICVAALLVIVAAVFGVIYYHKMRSRKADKKKQPGIL